MRTGKAWRHTDVVGQIFPHGHLQKVETLYEIVPIRPKGWVIFKDRKLAYAGLVWSKKAAVETLQGIKDRVARKRRFTKNDACSFVEDNVITPLEIDPPSDCQLSNLNWIDDKIDNQISWVLTDLYGDTPVLPSLATTEEDDATEAIYMAELVVRDEEPQKGEVKLMSKSMKKRLEASK